MHSNIKLRALIGPNKWAGTTLLMVRAVDLPNPRHGLLPPALMDKVQNWLHRRELLEAKAPTLSSLNWAMQLGALIAGLRRFAKLGPAQFHSNDDGATLLFSVEDPSLGHLTVDAAFALCQLAEITGGRQNEAFDGVLQTLQGHIRGLGFDVPVLLTANSAQALGIPHRRHSLLQDHYLIGEGRHQIVLDATDTNRTAAMAKNLAGNKDLTNALLGAYGFPVARQETITKAGEAWSAVQRAGLPAVIKPRLGRQGSGVVLNVATREEAVAAFEQAHKIYEEVLVESTLPGDDHRVMVIGEGVLALRRVPPTVTGDGTHTIAQLIARENVQRGKTRGGVRVIEANDDTRRLLALASRTMETVLGVGETQLLQLVPNASWVRTDVSNVVHPETRRMLIDAARLIGLDVASIDFRTPDISKSWREMGGGICEVESRSGLWALVRAESETGSTVTSFVRHLVAGKPLIIPQILAVGRGDMAPLDEWALSLAARCADTFGGHFAVQTSRALAIDGQPVPCEPLTTARACLRAIEHPQIGLAVYVATPESCLASGLGVERPDIVVVRDDTEQREVETIAVRAGAKVLPWASRDEVEAQLRAYDPVVVPAPG
jgi:cyanophycin synthetase